MVEKGTSRRHWRVLDEVVQLDLVSISSTYSGSLGVVLGDGSILGRVHDLVVHRLVPVCTVVWGSHGVAGFHDG